MDSLLSSHGGPSYFLESATMSSTSFILHPVTQVFLGRLPLRSSLVWSLSMYLHFLKVSHRSVQNSPRSMLVFKPNFFLAFDFPCFIFSRLHWIIHSIWWGFAHITDVLCTCFLPETFLVGTDFRYVLPYVGLLVRPRCGATSISSFCRVLPLNFVYVVPFPYNFVTPELGIYFEVISLLACLSLFIEPSCCHKILVQSVKTKKKCYLVCTARYPFPPSALLNPSPNTDLQKTPLETDSLSWPS